MNTLHIEAERRFRGCLLGLAVGDALGTTLEFTRPGAFEPVEDMVGGGPFNLLPGQWTDDTSMALCLAESLVACAGFDARDQMQRYLRWYHHGHLSSTGHCFDIGTTIRQALRDFETGGNSYSGSTHPHSAGNGSLMRLAPVPMFYAYQPADALYYAAESSRTTHGAQAAVDACRYYAGLIVGALHGVNKEELLSPNYSPVSAAWEQRPLAADIETIARGSFKVRNPPEIRATGYVVHSLEAALWAFYHGNSFREGSLLAINLGEDADTTGAIYGQLAGAYYGEADVPPAWLQVLALRDTIETLADQLYALARKQTEAA